MPPIINFSLIGNNLLDTKIKGEIIEYIKTKYEMFEVTMLQSIYNNANDVTLYTCCLTKVDQHDDNDILISEIEIFNKNITDLTNKGMVYKYRDNDICVLTGNVLKYEIKGRFDTNYLKRILRSNYPSIKIVEFNDSGCVLQFNS